MGKQATSTKNYSKTSMSAKKGSDPSTGSLSSGTEHRHQSSAARSGGMSDPLARWYNEPASQSPYNIIAEVPAVDAVRHSKSSKGHKKHGK